jgi:ATP synthase protein I
VGVKISKSATKTITKKTASSQAGAQLSRPPIGRVFSIQIVVLLTIAAVLLVVNQMLAVSALLGGLISIGPNSYFARWAFRFSGARAAGNIARSFYIGEAGKFILTVVLFGATFAFVKPINPLVLFLTYIFMTALNWVLALRFLKR